MKRKEKCLQKVFAGAFIALFSFSTFGGLDDGLIAYYPLDGNAIDASGNDHDGQVSEFSFCLDRYGNTAGAICSKQDVAQKIIIPHPVKPGFPFTICVWIKFNSVDNSRFGFSNDRMSCPGYYNGVSLGIRENIAIDYGDGGYCAPWSRRNFKTDSVISSGSWQHVAAVFRSHLDIKLFKNGIEIPITWADGSGGPIHYSNASGGISIFNGALDEVRVYNNALTESEILQLANSVNVIQLEKNVSATVKQGTQENLNVRLSNFDTLSHTFSIEVQNADSDNIKVSKETSSSLTLEPGLTFDISLGINAEDSYPGVYNNIFLKVMAENGKSVCSFIEVMVSQTDAPDLEIESKDIRVKEIASEEYVNIDISIHNNGTADATNVPVTIYRFNNFITTETISSISPGATQTIQVTVPMVTSGEHLINVFVDSSQIIQELDKTNNEASKIIKIGGQPVQPGGILVTAALPETVYTDALFNISGRTMYDIVVDGVRYLDLPVKGGEITLTVSNNEGDSWVYSGSHSTINGDFTKVVQAPSVAGDYTAIISATDQTFSGSRTISFTAIECPAQLPQPPQPSLPPHTCGSGTWIWYPGGGIWNGYWEWTWDSSPSIQIPQQDISVYSENIHFSENNPAKGEEMTIFTEFKYWSTSTTLDALNVPVNIYVTRPGSEKSKIGSVVVKKISVRAPENGSRFVYVNWENEQDGVYIVEAEVDPSYIESNMKNNAATRAIIVGEYEANQGILSGQVTGPEGGINNIGIELYDDYGMLRYTNTIHNGFYLIDALQAGIYTVKCIVPDGYSSDTVSRTVEIVDQQVAIADFTLYVDVPCIENLAARAKLNKIQLTWRDNGSSVYHIYRSEESAMSGFSEIATTSSTYSTYLDEGLTVGKTYWYKVTGAGNCSNSEVVSAVTQNRTVRTR